MITYSEESVSTVRAALELKSVFDQIQAAEKAGNLSPEEKTKLEEQAAEKGLQALFKVSLVLLIPNVPYYLHREQNWKWNQCYAKLVIVSLVTLRLIEIRLNCVQLHYKCSAKPT